MKVRSVAPTRSASPTRRRAGVRLVLDAGGTRFGFRSERMGRTTTEAMR